MPTLNNSTWAGMIAMNLRVDLYCDACGMSEELDLSTMPAEGRAIPIRFKCACGRQAGVTVSPRSVARAVPNQRVKIGP